MLAPNLQIKHRYIRMETVGSSQLEHATYSRYQKFVEKERMNYIVFLLVTKLIRRIKSLYSNNLSIN